MGLGPAEIPGILAGATDGAPRPRATALAADPELISIRVFLGEGRFEARVDRGWDRSVKNVSTPLANTGT